MKIMRNDKESVLLVNRNDLNQTVDVADLKKQSEAKNEDY
jgi:hypothetical protein